MWDMEEDYEDTIPLSQRTKVARAKAKEKRKSQSPPSPTIKEHPVQVEDLEEEEAQDELAAKELGNDEFKIEHFDFMLVGTTLEGNIIIDPKFLHLPEGPLGIPILPSPTPPWKIEGEIPLLLEGELEMPPTSK